MEWRFGMYVKTAVVRAGPVRSYECSKRNLTAHEVEQAADFAGVEFTVLAGGEIA